MKKIKNFFKLIGTLFICTMCVFISACSGGWDLDEIDEEELDEYQFGKNHVDIKASGNYVGGLPGACEGNVSSSVNEGDVSGGDRHNGGIAGYGYGTFTSCINRGIVNGTGEIGGIIGYVGGSTSKLDGCINNGTVTGSDRSVGGLVGATYATLEIILK